MDHLRVRLESFAEMTPDRAARVGRAFDAHPSLRPVRVGGDPARIRVGASLEAVIASAGLPVEWLTVRADGRLPEFEDGRIDLFEGRGGYLGTQDDMGVWHYLLTPHVVEATFLASTLDGPMRLAEVEAWFVDLAQAMDACYGYAVSEREWSRYARRVRPAPPATNVLDRLPDVFWLNCFGTAMVRRWPALQQVPDGRSDLANGAVVVRTRDSPWLPEEETGNRFEAGWKADVLHAIGTSAFATNSEPPGTNHADLPTVTDHLAASPGTEEMPWTRQARERDVRTRERAYDRARTRRLALSAAHPRPQALADETVEWSRSFDGAEWRQFFTRLRRQLKGELAGPLGTALAAEIVNAPLDAEDDIDVTSAHGTVRLAWFIDDVDVLDIAVLGSRSVFMICDRLLK